MPDAQEDERQLEFLVGGIHYDRGGKHRADNGLLLCSDLHRL